MTEESKKPTIVVYGKDNDAIKYDLNEHMLNLLKQEAFVKDTSTGLWNKRHRNKETKMNEETKPMTEPINQMMTVFIPTGKPPKAGEHFQRNQFDISLRTGEVDEYYEADIGFRRIEIPMPGEHVNEAGEKRNVLEIRRGRDCAYGNAWRVAYRNEHQSIECDVPIKDFLEWKSRKPKRKVMKTIERFVVIRSDGTEFTFTSRAAADICANSDGGRLFVLSRQYEVEEDEQ